MNKLFLNSKKSSAGFTLLEVMLVIGIFLATSGIIVGSFRNLFSTNTILGDSLTNARDAEQLINVMDKELREASPSSIGSYPLETVGSTSISFFSNIDNDVYKERINYFLQGTTLKKSVIRPAGTPLTYATTTATEQLSTVLKNVLATATPLFIYFDKTFSGTTTPLVQPISAIDIRHVRITLTIDKNTSDATPPITTIGEVTIRNLKDNY